MSSVGTAGCRSRHGGRAGSQEPARNRTTEHASHNITRSGTARLMRRTTGSRRTTALLRRLRGAQQPSKDRARHASKRSIHIFTTALTSGS